MRFYNFRAAALCVTVLACCLNPVSAETAKPAAGPDKVTLNDNQAKSIKVETLGERLFTVEKEAVGSVDFNEDLSVQVFPPYQGKIIEAFVKLGDEVKKGQPLYTINSPDLIQAEGTLIGAAATQELAAQVLARAKNLYENQGIAQKDLEQAISDQQTAEGALKAARDAVQVFGKSSAEIDKMIAQRRIDPTLVVPSPIAGKITARNAQPGLFVQPGNDPAPYNVADLSALWLLANVPESDSPHVRTGQSVKIAVMAYPGRQFEGLITRIAETVDPNVHTLTARSEIKDPDHLLRPGMIASFKIAIAAPQRAVALPVNGLVREGDGTLTAWVTTDQHNFSRRIVEAGIQQGGFRQIIDGLRPGELAATDGAVLLDNMAAGGTP
jgi:cobalt-zinc-cadmium efflux system membrane fusion protein